MERVEMFNAGGALTDSPGRDVASWLRGGGLPIPAGIESWHRGVFPGHGNGGGRLVGLGAFYGRLRSAIVGPQAGMR